MDSDANIDARKMRSGQARRAPYNAPPPVATSADHTIYNVPMSI